ncbi:hypothetical protein ACTMTJ_27200 [Phytohabitans sp. LJ34]|uniref:hypothetical protein n=1 Tax=Phytohabitans sp. LJ34 TaxID=3452217 RepID=UPI003F8A504F
MRTRVSRLLLGSAVVAAGVLGTASAAHAVPTGCSFLTGQPADTAAVQCTSGTGEVRVVVECTIFPPGRDPISTLHLGRWVGVGAISRAECRGGPVLTDRWFEVR